MVLPLSNSLEKSPFWLKLLALFAVLFCLGFLIYGAFKGGLTQLEYSRLTGAFLIALVFAVKPDLYWTILRGKLPLSKAPRAMNGLFFSGVMMLVFSSLVALVLSGQI